jgi:hypothetical protein
MTQVSGPGFCRCGGVGREQSDRGGDQAAGLSHGVLTSGVIKHGVLENTRIIEFIGDFPIV